LSVEVVEPDERLARDWEELAERTNAAPFLRPGWIAAWRSAFGRGRPLLVVARRGDSLAGVLPLEARGRSLRSPSNPHTPEFGLLAEDDEAAGALAEGVFAHGARGVVIEYLDAHDPHLALLCGAARAAGYRRVVRPRARAPYLLGRASLREHERSVSRNLRHDVERRLRRLCEAGAVSVEIADGGERLDALLDEGFRVEKVGWKGRRGTAIASRAETRRFYTDVARWASETGTLRLAFLRLDGHAIAFQFDLEAPRTYYSLKIGYDPAYERFSPGKLLAYTMVSRAISKGLESYELLGTDEPWKERWTDTYREQVALHAFAPTLVGHLWWFAFVHGRPLARRVPLASRVLRR
jgi:CelD/BcsL family acetyltransferase involved in cellulose biosynthesis